MKKKPAESYRRNNNIHDLESPVAPRQQIVGRNPEVGGAGTSPPSLIGRPMLLCFSVQSSYAFADRRAVHIGKTSNKLRLPRHHEIFRKSQFTEHSMEVAIV